MPQRHSPMDISTETIEILAPAKLNLALDVLGRREDGYHDLKMLMLSVDLYDRLTLTLTRDGQFAAASDYISLPRDMRNLALRAAALYFGRTGQGERGLRLRIQKRIPVSAGMGGGSSDAAAVLKALNACSPKPVDLQTLESWGLELGSDVPYCLRGGLCLAEGRGERLTPLPDISDGCFVLCTPPVPVSTRGVFSALRPAHIRLRPDWPGLLSALKQGDAGGVARRMYNVLEGNAATPVKELSDIRRIMGEGGALGVVMSGTGPTMLGFFDDENAAKAVQIQLRKRYSQTHLVHTAQKNQIPV